jgi:hypothetical protein
MTAHLSVPLFLTSTTSSWPLLDDVIGLTLGTAQHDVTASTTVSRDDVKMAAQVRIEAIRTKNLTVTAIQSDFRKFNYTRILTLRPISLG